MSWKRFARGNCPVCNGTRSDCRQNRFTGLIHCRDTDANPIDYIFRGTDRQGFAMWAYKPDAEAWNDERREEWIRQRQLERERKKNQYARSLSEPERDRTIRAILSQLRLTDAHRETLRGRGLSDAEIAAGQFRSVVQWQPLDFPVNDRLAGVKLGGNSLLTPDEGILCPIPNHRGELVSWQLRRDNPSDGGKSATRSGVGGRVSGVVEKTASSGASNPDQGKRPIEGGASNPMGVGASCFPTPHTPHPTPAPTGQGKYIWASGDKQIQPKPSAHLPNGELPIACFVHSALTGIVGLTEGTHIKPYIASLRLGIAVLGAAGGNFASSPATLKASLEATSASIVRLYADAGSVLNPQVLLQYQKTFNLLHSWGYLVEVGWWNQVEKASGDIDEISPESFAAIQYLSPDEFHSLAVEAQYKQKVGKTQQALHSLTYQPNLLANQKYLPDLLGLVPETGILAIKAHKGSGKSAQIQKSISHFRKSGKNIISITPRIALGREQARRWGLEWIDDIDTYGMSKTTVLEHSDGFGLCWDSLWRTHYKDWSNTVVIIDESELGFAHLLNSSTCKDRRSQILKTFAAKISECLAGNGLVILADADLTDTSIDYVKNLAPQGTKVFTVVNQALPDAWDIDFLSGRPDETIEQIFEAVEEGERLAIATDSQIEAEALDRCLAERFPDKKIIRIDRKTTETNFGRDFVAKPNESIRAERPDALIYTPSMGVGVSIDVKWFDRVFGLFYGVLEPQECRQALARVRDPVPRVVWASEASHFDESCKSFLPEIINKNFHKYHDRGLQLIDLAAALTTGDDPADLVEAMISALDPLTRQWNNPHLDCYCKLKARRNFGLSQLAIQLRQELIDEGHRLADWGCLSQTALGDEIAADKHGLKVEEASKIANADNISLEQAQSLALKTSATEPERHQATKALLRAELPDVELTPEFVYKAIIADRRQWLNRVKLWWYFTNFEKTKELDRREWRHKLKQFATGVVYLPDVRIFSPQVELIGDLGLFDLIDINNPEKEYAASDKAVVAFKQKAQFLANRLHTVFNLMVTPKTDPIRLLERLLKKVGLGFTSRQVRVDGQRVRYYKLSLLSLQDPDRIAVIRSLDVKYAQILSGSRLEGVTALANNLNIQASAVTATDCNTQGLDTTRTLEALDARSVTFLAAEPIENTSPVGSQAEVWETESEPILDAVTLPVNNVDKPEVQSVTAPAVEPIEPSDFGVSAQSNASLRFNAERSRGVENKLSVFGQAEVVETESEPTDKAVTLPANNVDKPEGQSVTVPLLPTWEQVMSAIDAELDRLNWTLPSAIAFLKGVYGKHSRHLLSDSQLLDFLTKLKQFMPTYGSQSPLSPGDVINHTVKGRGTLAWVSGDGRFAVVVWSNGQVSDPIYTYMMMPSTEADSA